MAGLSEAFVAQLLAAELTIHVLPQWVVKPNSVRTVFQVDNRLAQLLFLDMRISRHVPEKYTLNLRREAEVIRRLDVRGSHRNPLPPRERWNRQTHKHMFRDGLREEWAYTPQDLPLTPLGQLGTDEYEMMFRAFCAECQIDVQIPWPPVTVLPPYLSPRLGEEV